MELLEQNEYYLVIRHFFKEEELEPNSIWQGSSGNTVKIISVEDDQVYYLDGETIRDKSVFAFQVRYSLVVYDLNQFNEKYQDKYKITTQKELDSEY